MLSTYSHQKNMILDVAHALKQNKIRSGRTSTTCVVCSSAIIHANFPSCSFRSNKLCYSPFLLRPIPSESRSRDISATTPCTLVQNTTSFFWLCTQSAVPHHFPPSSEHHLAILTFPIPSTHSWLSIPLEPYRRIEHCAENNHSRHRHYTLVHPGAANLTGPEGTHDSSPTLLETP